LFCSAVNRQALLFRHFCNAANKQISAFSIIIPLFRVVGMKGQKREEWMRLCEQAANEQDSAKLLELVKEINRLLEEKEDRLRKQGS